MKNFYILALIFILSSCQTLSSIQETLGFVQEDPNAPVKLDESYEIKSSEEQNTLINDFESSEEKILDDEMVQKNFNDEIPTGVSIESASYMEHNDNTNYVDPLHQNNSSNEKNFIEEYAPKLFSDEQNQVDVETKDRSEENATDQLFDQDTNEDEDFEIPAFLRRQKF